MAKTVCFIGHRNCKLTTEQNDFLTNTVKSLILDGFDIFLFGSRSKFDYICHETVTILKQEFPHIKRVFVRAEFPYASKLYLDDLVEDYEETFYPEILLNSGKYAYVERNQYMIDKSDVCIFAFDENYTPPAKPWLKVNKTLPLPTIKSGTAIAYKYALQKKKNLINVLEIKKLITLKS